MSLIEMLFNVLIWGLAAAGVIALCVFVSYWLIGDESPQPGKQTSRPPCAPERPLQSPRNERKS